MPKELAGQDATDFDDLLAVIERAKLDAARAVNRELIGLYWSIGEHISAKTRSEGWGKAVIARFAERVQQRFPGISGFSPVNIWRMRTFYEAYAGNELLSAPPKDLFRAACSAPSPPPPNAKTADLTSIPTFSYRRRAARRPTARCVPTPVRTRCAAHTRVSTLATKHDRDLVLILI